jgi:hypothetical protein
LRVVQADCAVGGAGQDVGRCAGGVGDGVNGAAMASEFGDGRGGEGGHYGGRKEGGFKALCKVQADTQIRIRYSRRAKGVLQAAIAKVEIAHKKFGSYDVLAELVGNFWCLAGSCGFPRINNRTLAVSEKLLQQIAGILT